MLALIDGDVVVHRVGYTTDGEDFGIASYRCDEMLDGILADTEATKYQVWLSDSAENNFRYQIYPQYKANRKEKVRPEWLEKLKEHVIVNWNARFAYGMEADDALGIHQDSSSMICSIDKDLQQIPGDHYNFVTKEFVSVTEMDGLRWFYKQILIGDTSDNIPGCPGIGPVKAEKIIGGCNSEKECLEAVVDTFTKQYKKKNLEDLNIYDSIQLSGSLLKIRQREDEGIWQFPFHLLNLTAEKMLSSIQQTPEEFIQSTEPTT